MNLADDGNKEATPNENRLEKILKEKFGNPGFEGLMNSIVDQMLNDMANKDGGKPKSGGAAEAAPKDVP